MTNKKFFKSLLTTASMTCALTCGVADANAAVARWVIANNARYLDVGGSPNWASVTAGGLHNGGPQNGNWIILGGAYNIIADNTTRVLSFDVNSFGGQTLTVTNAANPQIGSIVDSSGNNRTIDIIFDGVGGGATLQLNGTANPTGTSTGGAIAAGTYTGLRSVNLNNNGTLEVSSASSVDLTNVSIYGAGTLNVFGSHGVGASNTPPIIFGGTIGYNGGVATATIVNITSGDGSANGIGNGADIVLNAVNTTDLITLTGGKAPDAVGVTPTGNSGNIIVTSTITGGMHAAGGRGGNGAGIGGRGGNGGSITFQDSVTNSTVLLSDFGGGNGGNAGASAGGGNGGDLIFLKSVTSNASNFGFSGGNAGATNGLIAGGNGGSVFLNETVIVGANRSIIVTPGKNAGIGSNNGLGGNVIFSNGIIIGAGGMVYAQSAGGVNGQGVIKISGNITGTTGSPSVQLMNAAVLTIDSTNRALAVIGQITSVGNNQQLNISGSNSITFNDSVAVDAAGGVITFLANTPVLLGSGGSIAALNIQAKTAGATIMAASGANASLSATNIDSGAQPITIGATSAGTTLSFTNTTFTGSVINVTGSGSVGFTNGINSPIKFITDSVAQIPDGQNITANVNSTGGIGTLASSGSVSISGNVTGIKSIQFSTLKVVPGNFSLSGSATIGTVDFNNGTALAIGSGGALTYNSFTNTAGASQIQMSGPSSVTSLGAPSSGSTLPLITTSGNATFTGNINATNIRSTEGGNIILSNATIPGSVTGAIMVGSGTSSVNILTSATIAYNNSNGNLSIQGVNQINNVTKVTTGGGGILALQRSGTLVCDIGSSDGLLTSLQIGGGSTLTNNGKNIYARNLMPLAAGANLNLSGGSLRGSAGSLNNGFSNITLNNFPVTGDMYATNFIINGIVTLTNSSLNGLVSLIKGSFLDATNGTFNGNITGTGNVKVGQDVLSNPIGASGSNVGTVEFTPTQHTLGSNIYGTSVVADNSSLILSNSVQVANLSAENLTLTPNNNSLTLPHGGNLTGLTNINLTLNSLTTNITPYINITGGTLNLSDLQISITDNVGVGNSGAQFFIIGGSNNYSAAPNVTDNMLVTWTYNNATGILSSALDQQAVNKVVGSLEAHIPNVANYFDLENTGDAFLAEYLIAGATMEEAQEIVAQLESTSQDVAQSATINDATLDNIRNTLNRRTDDYLTDMLPSNELLSEAELGVAAGEEEDKSRRVWVSTTKTGKSDMFSDSAKFSKFRISDLSASGFGGFSDLGRIKGAPGSRTKTYGCSTGIDTRVSERWMAGGAFTYTENTTTMHNALIGSTYYSKGWVATLYGLYNVTNSWSVRTGLSYGNTTNTNNARRLVKLPSVHRIAYAKYNSRFISPDVSMSYRISLPNRISFIPSIGMQYIYTNADPYNEIGARPLDMIVKKKPEKGVLSGNIGLSFSTSFKIGDTLIKPEIHGSFKRALRGRNPTTLSKLNGAAKFIRTRSHPTKKVTYAVGGSLTVAINKMLDMGVGYDASLGEKYRAHRGSLKVRVNL